MLGLSPLMTRTALAKWAGLAFGIAGFYVTKAFMPFAGPLLPWGVLALYLTIGAMVGLVGTIDRIPWINLRLSPLVRGAAMGAWVTLICVLFGFIELAAGMAQLTWFPAFLQSPWWFIADGAFAGAVIDVVISRILGPLPSSVD